MIRGFLWLFDFLLLGEVDKVQEFFGMIVVIFVLCLCSDKRYRDCSSLLDRWERIQLFSGGFFRLLD